LTPQTEATLLLGWWNTSLSPVGKQRADARSQKIAEAIVKILIDIEGLDCLALGEVTSEDLQNLKKSIDSTHYDVDWGEMRKSRLFFDVGIIYNTQRLYLNDSRLVIDRHGKQALKVARRIDFTIIDTNEPVHVFISHWPSRLWCSEHDAKRDTLGMRLRDAIEGVKEAYQDPYDPQIILLGDYNDEPFARSLAEHLPASRDRTLVNLNAHYFYNPFWRLLGESLPHSNNMTSKSFAGTYFHKKGNVTRWLTFDQIMVSSSFLQDDRWYLNEKYTTIWRHPPLDDLVENPGEIFDHFPVISVIQRQRDQRPHGERDD